MTSASVKSRPRRKAIRSRGRPRNEALQARRREEILDNAIVVFAQHGYRNTDVQWIADPLGISKGTVYRYFPNKERLFLASVERGVDLLDATMEQTLARVADPIERLAVGTITYLRFFEANPGVAELFIQERAEFREKRKPIYFEKGCRSECHWRGMIEQLITDGRLRRMPPERVMTVAGDLLYGTMFTNHFLGRPRPIEDQAADINDILFNGVLSPRERARQSRGSGTRASSETSVAIVR